MTNPENLPLRPHIDPVAAIARHLREGEDIIRCAAARAIGAVGDERAAPDLVDALLDEDPDVRSDAMAALVTCARQEDADAIRRSLMGDPVREVKVSAIQSLCRLKDGASIPLLRVLVKDRCDHDIAWAEDSSIWDDWLDVQDAAITALGALGVHEAIEDLLEARNDEMGQDLDHVIFATLGQIPDGGIAALLDFLRDGNARVRERALSALSKARGDLLAPMSDLLVQDASPDVRRLAIGCLDRDSPLVPDLALRDPDITVRSAALAAFVSSRLDIAEAALADPDEEVKALALEAVVAGSEQSDSHDLAANVQTWMETGGARLAATCAAVLPQLSGGESVDALCRVAADTDRPQEVRIAALRSLGTIGAENSIETLRNAATDPIRQVRTSALAALAELAKQGPEPLCSEAQDVLVGAIRADLTGADAPLAIAAEAEKVSFIDASKVEDAAPRGIRITPDGEIVSMEDLPDHLNDQDDIGSNVIEGQFPQSTLRAIQTQQTALSWAADAPLSDDEPAQPSTSKPEGRRRRVAVDGPDDTSNDLRLVALRIAADCPGYEIEQALAGALSEEMPDVRVAAFEAMAQRSEKTPLSSDVISKLTNALDDPDPHIRGYASRAVAMGSNNAADHLAACLDDPDAIVRAIALKTVAASAPDVTMAGFRDDSALVRRSALESVLEFGNTSNLKEGLRICLEEGRIDSLAEAIKRSTEARSILISILAGENMTRRQTHSALEALAAAGPPV